MPLHPDLTFDTAYATVCQTPCNAASVAAHCHHSFSYVIKSCISSVSPKGHKRKK
jgi:hypothetical protein